MTAGLIRIIMSWPGRQAADWEVGLVYFYGGEDVSYAFSPPLMHTGTRHHMHQRLRGTPCARIRSRFMYAGLTPECQIPYIPQSSEVFVPR